MQNFYRAVIFMLTLLALVVMFVVVDNAKWENKIEKQHAETNALYGIFPR